MKEELEQKHVHLMHVVESEKTAKWQYTQQCEELVHEIRKLRAEVNVTHLLWKTSGMSASNHKFLILYYPCVPVVHLIN